MCTVGKNGLEEGIKFVGETEVKAYVTEKMTFAWKWPECSLRSRIMYFQLCVSKSLVKCPRCNKCSMNVGWVNGDWLAGWLGECGQRALEGMTTSDWKHRGREWRSGLFSGRTVGVSWGSGVYGNVTGVLHHISLLHVPHPLLASSAPNFLTTPALYPMLRPW